MFNTFDLICALFILLVAVLGYFRGLFHQLATLFALGLSIIASAFVAEPFMRMQANHEILTEIQSYYLIRIVGSAVIYFILAIFIWYADSRLADSGINKKPLNRFGGFLFGFFKSVTAVVLLLVGLSYIEPHRLERLLPSLNHSFLLTWVRRHNPVNHERLAKNLQIAFKIVKNPKDSPRFADFLQRRGVVAEKRIEDLKHHRLWAIIRDNQFRRILSELDSLKDFEKE